MTISLDAIRSGDRAALGRALTLVESRLASDRALVAALLDSCLPYADSSVAIAITGLPGSGKSTLTDRLGAELVAAGHRVAVLAVDPTSTKTGGSILGDKTRMDRLARLDDAFIRPSPTSGALGGVAATTRASILVCAAAGFDIVLVETVGVGQSEVTVAGMADRVILVTLAGGGDGLQGIKRGILETCDLVLVNKADGDGVLAAEQAARELSDALHLLRTDQSVPVWAVSATEGTGLDGIVTFVEDAESGDHRTSPYALTVFDEALSTRLLYELEHRAEFKQALDVVRKHVSSGDKGPHEAVEHFLSRISLDTDS